MFGLTIEGMKVNGKTTKCTERESSHEQMAESMKETTMMIRNKDKESSHGQTEESMMESGSMVNNMAKEFIIPQREKSKEENGKKGRESGGLAKNETPNTMFMSYYFHLN